MQYSVKPGILAICAGMHSNGFSGSYRITILVMGAGAPEVVTTENERECVSAQTADIIFLVPLHLSTSASTKSMLPRIASRSGTIRPRLISGII